MRNLILCLALIAAAMFGPFLWAWYGQDNRPLPASIAAAEDQEPEGDDSRAKNDGPAPLHSVEVDDLEPPSTNPMINAMRQMLNDSPAFEEHGDDLRDQLNQADVLLTKIKEENKAALARMKQGIPVRRPRQGNSRAKAKPNLIVIDLGRLAADSLPCYNESASGAKLFDHLASQGVRFDRFYRSSLEPVVERSRFLTMDPNAPPLPAAPQSDVLAKRLVDAGYETGFIGDIEFGDAEPHVLGFDSWFGTRASKLAESAWPTTVWSDGAALKLVMDDQERFDSQTILMTEAFSFAKRQKASQPFFLWLSLPLPDMDFPTRPDDASSDAETPVAEQLPRIEQQLIDWITELNKRKIANNSIVAITSLSPPRLADGEHPLSQRRLRAPLIVLGPGRVSPKQSTDALCTSADLAHTLASLAGANLEDAGDESHSLERALIAQAERSPSREARIWRHGDDEVLIFDHWRYERRDGKTLGLFDLDSDDEAANNVAGLHPQVIVEAKRRLSRAAD